MWEPFKSAVNELMPQADIVHDRFHISGYLNEAVDSVRKKEHKALLGEGNKLLTKSKYLWLKDTANHTKDEKIKFKELKNHTTRVGRAWAIKEAFRKFWSYWYMKPAKQFFDRWYYWATHSRIPDIIKVAKMLKKHF
ncbi:MAG: transposase, partial [Myxococcota bacterium]